MDYLAADRKEHDEFRLENARKSSVERPMSVGQKLTPGFRGRRGGYTMGA